MGFISYYAQATGTTLLMVFSTIDAEQMKATKFTMCTVRQLLNYCTTHQNVKADKIQYDI